MALTQQQLDATRKYKAGDITSDQYKQAYVTNYDPTKDKSFGKNIAYSGTSSPEATRIQEMSQAYQNSVSPQVMPQVIPQVMPQVQMPAYRAPVYQQPAYQAPDYSQYINGLAEQTKAKNVADLQRAYEKSIGSLNQEQETIKPKFEQGRSGLRRVSMNQAKDFENFLASKGIASSGTTVQGAISTGNELLGGLGQSNVAQAGAESDIERRRSGLGTDLQYGISSANSAADIEAARQLMELKQLQDTRAYNDSKDAANRAYEESRTAAERSYNESREAQGFAREDAQATQDRTREDFINTIGGVRDYSAQINTVQNDGNPSNDWQIPFLQQAKQEKIVNQNLDPRTGKPLPVDNTQKVWDAAYKKWNAGIPLTGQEMKVIGATTSVKPKVSSGGSSGGSRTTITQDRNYQEDRWQRLGKADQAIADAWGVPVGTSFSSKPVEVEQADIGEYDDYINTYYRTNTDGVNSVDKNGIAIYLVELEKAGKSDEAIELAIKYNISDKTIEEAERILNSRR